ncbi:MAG: hypothetical protein ABSH04_06255, partial [Acidimicrobiales bacterium]
MTRADVDGVVRRSLDVRKASFPATERAIELTGMSTGDHPYRVAGRLALLVDQRVNETDVLVIGSGVRRSKILLPGATLGLLPSARRPCL